jgi:acyl-CoA thioesterase FadM
MIPRFSGAMTGLMAHLGLSRPVLLRRHLGYAALDCGFEHPALLRPGQSVDVRSGVLEVGRKALRIFHDVLDTTSGDLVAAMEVVLVFFDLHARKSVTMPAEIVARASEVTPR